MPQGKRRPPEFDQRVHDLARAGLTYQEIANDLGTNVQSISGYCYKHRIPYGPKRVSLPPHPTQHHSFSRWAVR